VHTVTRRCVLSKPSRSRHERPDSAARLLTDSLEPHLLRIALPVRGRVRRDVGRGEAVSGSRSRDSRSFSAPQRGFNVQGEHLQSLRLFEGCLHLIKITRRGPEGALAPRSRLMRFRRMRLIIVRMV
jgi:hypothetical protein